MKLIPKAKPIRIRIVSGGKEHSSIETLRSNYSLDDIIPLVKDGRLHKWLLRVGETKAAEDAYILRDSNTYPTSKDMVDLTASIFNTTARNIEDLLWLWEEQYPKSFFNYIKANGGTFKNISKVRKLYGSIKKEDSEMTENEWQEIFVTTLKRMPLLAVLEDFKKFNSVEPMHAMAWLKVLNHHANISSDEELYLIAQAAYDYPGLKNEAVEWYKKSARTCIKAKEWVNKNYYPTSAKRPLTPKENGLFDSFESNPSEFHKKHFNTSYPQDLVRFLNVLSSIYLTNYHPYFEEITGRGEFTKYLFIIDALYHIGGRGGVKDCIRELRRLPHNHPDEFKDYKTLDRIIQSFENKEPIFEVKLWDVDYRDRILFIARLAKVELGYEK